MAEYIKREDALREICFGCEYEETCDAPCYFAVGVAELPAADVVEVKMGKWEEKEVFEAKGHVDELQSAFCPVCKRYHTTPYSDYFTHYLYCPNCGARMEGTE